MAERLEDQDPNFRAATVDEESGICWRDAGDDAFTVRGLAWFAENDRRWQRFPDRAEGLVRPPVWELSRHTAGARVCFRSDTTRFLVEATLLQTNIMSHMPLTGSSGLALYEGEPGQQKPWPVAFPQAGEGSYKRSLFEDAPKRLRSYTLYLPLYNGLKELRLGLDADAIIEPPPPPVLDKPVVFYGSSITQGGCAHNPGADYPSIIGRLLKLDTINLGFSGNGKGEPEVAELLAEIDAGAFVLDYVANSGPDGMEATLPTVLNILRAKHPTTPIIIVTRLIYSQVHRQARGYEMHERQRDICMGIYCQRRTEGDANLHFIDGNSLIPFGEDLAYSDGVHPSNQGFGLMAQRMAPQLHMVLLRETF